MDKFTQEVNEAILKHKWIESEKVGKDIGIINARRDWLINHWGSQQLNQKYKFLPITVNNYIILFFR